MLAFLRKLFRRQPAEPELPPGTTPSRVPGGLSPNDPRLQHTAGEKNMAKRLGVRLYDSKKRQL